VAESSKSAQAGKKAQTAKKTQPAKKAEAVTKAAPAKKAEAAKKTQASAPAATVKRASTSKADSGTRELKAYKVPKDFGKPKSDNPKWLLPTIVTLLVVGPAWIITYYVTSGRYPLEIGHGNLLVGFGFLIASMVLLTRWK